MILTCPECATSYFVADGRIPAQGRRVKCSSCGHRWMAGPDGPIPEPASVAPEPERAPAPAPAEPEAHAPDDDLDVVPAEVAPAPARIRPPAPRRTRSVRADARSSALVWAGAAALAVALIAGALVFREQVVRLWPKSSVAFAGLGLAVEGGGLVLEQVQVKPNFLGGRPVLAVTGAIRNVRDVPVDAPPVRLTLLNRAGQPVAAKIARPAEATIPAGATRHFAVTMLDPPATARDLEVRFESSARSRTTVRAEAAAVPAAPPPAPPVEATPAPAAPLELSPTGATEHG